MNPLYRPRRAVLDNLSIHESLPEHPIAYVNRIFESPSIYGIKAILFQNKFILHVMFSYSTNVTTFSGNYAEGEELITYLKENKDSPTIDADIIDAHHYKQAVITKPTRVSHSRLLESGGTGQEVIDFVANAYRNGVNIIVAGEPFSGKTAFINGLIDSAGDNQPTIVVSHLREMLYGLGTENIVEIFGGESSILDAALVIGHKRIVIDSYFDFNKMDEVILANQDRQYIVSSYHRAVFQATEEDETFRVTRFPQNHGFQLRVDLQSNIGSVSMTNPGGHAFVLGGVHEIIETEGISRLHTIYYTDKRVNEPTESLASHLVLKSA